MSVVDKSGVFVRLARGDSVSVELGCGRTKKESTSIGIDMMDLPGVDLVGDVYEVLAQFPEASVDNVYSSHFFEHVPDLEKLLQEVSRVLKPGGSLQLTVPHFSNPYYYSDPTHRTPFGLYTLAYFCEQNLFRRNVPNYGFNVALVIDDVRLGFKSVRPRYLTHALKLVIGFFVNSTTRTMEWYEENLCWIFPCFEIKVKLHRK